MDIGIILLAAIVHASLQLGLGSLILLYHESAGKYVTSKTKALVSSFLSGSGTIIFLALGATAFVIGSFFGGSLEVEILALVISLLVVLAISVWFVYYRRGTSTELWLPKSVASYINTRARATSNNTEAFSLGMLTVFGEAPFVIVLVTVAGNSVADFDILWQPMVVALYTLIAVLPLWVVRFSIRRGKTAHDLQRWRNANKTFIMIMSGLGFVILGAFLLCFRILR